MSPRLERVKSFVSSYWRFALWLLVSILAGAIAFYETGALIGYLIGVSLTPVIGASLPIIFGILGALSYGILDRQSRSAAYSEKLDKFLTATTTITATDQDKLKKLFEHDPVSDWMVVAWCVGIIIFCVSVKGNIELGTKARKQALQQITYPTSEAFFQKFQIPPRYTELQAPLQCLYLRCQFANMPLSEINSLFTHILADLKKNGESRTSDTRIGFVKQIIESLPNGPPPSRKDEDIPLGANQSQ